MLTTVDKETTSCQCLQCACSHNISTVPLRHDDNPPVRAARSEELGQDNPDSLSISIYLSDNPIKSISTGFYPCVAIPSFPRHNKKTVIDNQ